MVVGMMTSVCYSMCIGGLFSADICFLLIFLCCSSFWGIPASAWSPMAAVSLLVSQLWHCNSWGFSCNATPPAPTVPSSVQGYSLERCSLQILAATQHAQSEALHCSRAASSCSAAFLSLHRSPLRHASTRRLVKACQNNPLNPQRKDLIKLFYSGIHAACWTACSMTSSMAYECQCFTEAY